jgi:hypothetical protein
VKKKRGSYNKAPRQAVQEKPGLWEDDCAALERLFRNLPIRRPEGETTGIPYEFLIGDIPHQLLLMRPRQPDKRPKVAGTKKALHLLAQAAGRTARILEDLPLNARAALCFRPAVLQQLLTNLRVLEADAKADKKVETGRPKKARSKAPEPPNNEVVTLFYPDGSVRYLETKAADPKTKPEIKVWLSQAEKVADVVAQHYFGLTGEKPTAHNQAFIELLGGVYKVLGIDASASSQATVAKRTRQT